MVAQHIYGHGIFPFDLFPPPNTVIITATKETAFPLCSGKVPLAMLKCSSFLCLLSLGK